MDFVFETIFYVIFSFIGAFFRWIFFLCKKPYSYYMNQDTYTNGVLGVLITTLIIMGVYHSVKGKTTPPQMQHISTVDTSLSK
jgi:hypothetical protein